MNLIIIGKASLASLGLVAIVWGSVAISQNTNTHFGEERIEGFFSVKDRALSHGQESPFKCKIETVLQEEFLCDVISIVDLTSPINNQIEITPKTPAPPLQEGETYVAPKMTFSKTTVDFWKKVL